MSDKVQAKDHDSYWTYTLIGLLIPMVGFIIGAIMMTKDSKVDRKLGEHTIVISILGSVLAIGFWIFWAMNQTASPVVNPYSVY